MIVGGGVVLAASYEAKARGIRTAMGGGRARALCPEAVVVKPRFQAYTEASRAVFEIFRRTAPVVEALSIDEAFMDVRGLGHISGTPLEIGRTAAVARSGPRRVSRSPSGVACTKFLAKVASAVAKPDGLLLVPSGCELEFLHPLPVTRLWGVGRVTAEKLHAQGITTVGEVARLDERVLIELAGRAMGRQLHALAHNRDPRRGQAAPPAPFDRRPAGARQPPARAGRDRGGADDAGRPGHPADARRRPGVPHGRAAAAVRRLHARDQVPHDRRGDDAHGDAAASRARAAARGRRS